MQGRGADRLAQVGVDRHVEDVEVGFDAGDERDSGGEIPSLDGLDNVQTGGVRHFPVEQDDVDLGVQGRDPRVAAVGRPDVILLLQEGRVQVREVGVVVDDQHGRIRGGEGRHPRDPGCGGGSC